ncbi:preprotein translocase subunit SecD [Lentzea albidocapillata subsp. violacea]|uniref:Protein translocase subunit SecD n=1 Tax=Lentzea albidocapillata subsp. violacea TaxID=128104 RepID=A0A1G9EPY5_9PSEU|nr:protein translocase subunit SecD [Lentzea albidocapillata]SDK78133.1 preprotein translocase subunit SecD [Lentzea albidocapillata subsp. violacea]
MAPPAGQIRPAKYLASFVLIVVALYALVFLTGNGSAKPKLGIDLQGGTLVTLTARQEDGAQPSEEALNRARDLIEVRVNGLGVSGAEVVRDGNNLVITVPGADSEGAKGLGQTARLAFRKVIGQPVPAGAVPQTQTSTPPSGDASTPPSTPPSESAGSPPPSSGAPQGRPAPNLAAQPSSTPPPSSTAPPSTPSAPANVDPRVAKEIQEAKALRQSTDPQVLQQAALLLDCTKPDPLRGNDDLDKPLVTCDEKGEFKYTLAPVNPPKEDTQTKADDYANYSRLTGEDISNAAANNNPNGTGYVVNLDFKSEGGTKWGAFTAANVQQAVAVVLDGEVMSAPTIQSAISGGSTEISGKFTLKEAQNLANTLKYGALPLSFDASEAQTVSPTLGLQSLKAGLIAGGIGLALVFVYCMFYYRLLGVLTILSLALSAVVIYAVLVLLGRVIGFTLDLAGIAGFIVAIGITADSFIVFFERLKDEVREGRTFRSAVPRAWVRSRRTILSADAVSFIAAAVLYVIAVGQVKGFAFTLGMSTVLDLVVVFLVTHPLVAIASKSKFLTNSSLSGLGGAAREGAAHRATTTGKTAVKEA